jgi:hypothetical protein
MMEMTLIELIEQHDASFFPEDFGHDILDDLQFMVMDLDTGIMAFACAHLEGKELGYKPDMEHWGRIQSKIASVDDLTELANEEKGRLLAWMASLRMIVKKTLE